MVGLPSPSALYPESYREVEKGTKKHMTAQEQAKHCPDRILQLSLLDHAQIPHQDFRAW